MRSSAPASEQPVRSSTLATLALYAGLVGTLADEADRDGGGGDTMH